MTTRVLGCCNNVVVFASGADDKYLKNPVTHNPETHKSPSELCVSELFYF